MSKCGQGLQAPPDTPSHYGSLPLHTVQEAAQRLFNKNTACKNTIPLQMSVPDGELLEADIESLEFYNSKNGHVYVA